MIVFCTTSKGRTPHLSRTLPKNLADNPDSKFIVLDYNDQDSLASYLQTNHAKDIQSGRLVVYQYKESVPFRMAHAKNMAHRLGIIEGADILVNLDADNWTNAGFGDYIGEQFNEQNIFMRAIMVKGEMPRGINGRIVVTKEAFLNSGGYDELYTRWSPDDKDFVLRLRRLGYEQRFIDPKFIDCIPHNDKIRFREYEHVSGHPGEEDEENLKSQDHTIVNSGNIGCGIVYRNFSSERIEVPAVPTRIFGIGMHKTATTSLHRAFEILGYKSGHWKTAHWAKAIWRQMNEFGKSPTLETHYALSDLPIPLLYRKLDVAYPGSKFILTIRDEVSWIQSIRKHFSDANRFRSQWDCDPFSHQIHKILYGRTDFEFATFLNRYRRHNSEVLEYFKDRKDLLVLNMDKGDGWKELCTFLNVPVPQEPYPVVGVAGH